MVRAAAADVRWAPVSGLLLDPRNPRLLGDNTSQPELLHVLWRDFAVNEVAISIAANGFWQYEPLVVATENGKQYVIEGNRRLAAVILLLNTDERQRVGATSLPEISAELREDLQTVPVIDASRESAWQYLGFKHVNGPQAWQSYSKAQYIAWVHNNLRVSLENIAETIGDAHDTVSRLYRSLMVLEQAEKEHVWDRDDRYKSHFSFSHLTTGLNSYSGIQQFLGLDGPPPDSQDPIPEEALPHLGEVLLWMYGSSSEQIEPLVRSQNPHLRQLDKVLQDENATAAVRSGLPLDVALDIAKGDVLKLRENLVSAKRLLQDSRGKILTGYSGEAELLTLAEDIVGLADAIADEMRTMKRRARRTRSGSAT